MLRMPFIVYTELFFFLFLKGDTVSHIHYFYQAECFEYLATALLAPHKKFWV